MRSLLEFDINFQHQWLTRSNSLLASSPLQHYIKDSDPTLLCKLTHIRKVRKKNDGHPVICSDYASLALCGTQYNIYPLCFTLCFLFFFSSSSAPPPFSSVFSYYSACSFTCSVCSACSAFTLLYSFFFHIFFIVSSSSSSRSYSSCFLYSSSRTFTYSSASFACFCICSIFFSLLFHRLLVLLLFLRILRVLHILLLILLGLLVLPPVLLVFTLLTLVLLSPFLQRFINFPPPPPPPRLHPAPPSSSASTSDLAGIGFTRGRSRRGQQR